MLCSAFFAKAMLRVKWLDSKPSSALFIQVFRVFELHLTFEQLI
jgi:hypothetical protein